MESDRILVKWEYQNFVKLNFLVLLYSGKPFRLYCPNLLQSSCKRKEQANAFIVDEHIVTSHYAHHIFAVISVSGDRLILKFPAFSQIVYFLVNFSLVWCPAKLVLSHKEKYFFSLSWLLF